MHARDLYSSALCFVCYTPATSNDMPNVYIQLILSFVVCLLTGRTWSECNSSSLNGCLQSGGSWKGGMNFLYLCANFFLNREANIVLVWVKPHLQVPVYKHIADLAGKTNYNLPVPAFTLISGGKHAWNNLAIQVSHLATFMVDFNMVMAVYIFVWVSQSLLKSNYSLLILVNYLKHSIIVYSLEFFVCG